MCMYTWKEAQLPQRDHATRYVSKFVLLQFHEVWELEKFQNAKVTFKGIGKGDI